MQQNVPTNADGDTFHDSKISQVTLMEMPVIPPKQPSLSVVQGLCTPHAKRLNDP